MSRQYFKIFVVTNQSLYTKLSSSSAQNFQVIESACQLIEFPLLEAFQVLSVIIFIINPTLQLLSQHLLFPIMFCQFKYTIKATDQLMLSELQKKNLAKLQNQYNLDHLRPPPQVYEITHTESQHFQPTTSDKRRRIYYKVKYQPKQEKAIEQTKLQLKKKGLAMHKIPDQVILKHVYGGDWESDKVVDRLQQIIDFHTSEKATNFTQQTIQKLTKGQIYTYGHDRQFRPNVVMRVDKFDLNLPLQEHFNAFYFLMLVVLGYRMVPYHAEKYNFFMDLNNISIPDLPLRYLYSALEKTGVFYCGNSQKTFVFNADGMGHIWKVISFFLPENQKKRVIFVSKGEQHTMLQYMDANQLQKKYGGILPNLTQYWPPKSPKEIEGKLNLSLSQSEFYSVCNDDGYFIEEGENREISNEGNCQCNIY